MRDRHHSHYDANRDVGVHIEIKGRPSSNASKILLQFSFEGDGPSKIPSLIQFVIMVILVAFSSNFKWMNMCSILVPNNQKFILWVEFHEVVVNVI